MKNTISILFLILSITAFSQFSKVHYIPPVSHSDSQPVQNQYLYISCPSVTPINFTVKLNDGNVAFTGVVSRDLPYSYQIGFGDNTQILIDRANVNQIMNNKGYIIEADDLVYVCLRMTASTQNNQAGSIVSKGLAAAGQRFRIGALKNTGITTTNNIYFTFATILALENNTTIKFSDIKPGVSLINNAGVGNNPTDIILNQGQSYAIAVEGPNEANKDGLIGALIASNKDIVVNCGSFVGSSGNILNNVDIGMDQIVSAERTGTEYIFIKGNGNETIERPMIVADKPDTQVFLNGNSTAVATLQPGQYLALAGNDFTPGTNNLYVRTSEKVFAYQGIGGTTGDPNQNMHFVPPLSCATPKSINNIPLINKIGNLDNFVATVCLVTETGSTLNFIVNGVNYSLATLSSSSIAGVSGPFPVVGKPEFVTYKLSDLTGNVSVFSSTQLYLSYFGSSGFATYGGFYSGFTYNPEITFKNLSASQSGCIPFVELTVNSISAFDIFNWFQDGNPISGTTSIFPTIPDYYYSEGIINACGVTQVYKSFEIPVSVCAPDSDNDLINDNIDFDLDNDGIPNCSESYVDGIINTSNLLAGNINSGTYSNSFIGKITNSGSATPVGTLTGNVNSFVTQVPVGKKNKVKYELTFLNPISVSLQYPALANASDLMNSNSNFIANSDKNSTITVLNPTNQLLIDTNYDGIYESGVTRFSSFEIRFRLNSSTPLAAGTGNFSFRGHLVKSFAITQENLSETSINRATFSLLATCIPRDSDADGLIDQLDLDSDNDGITDNIEFVNQNNISKSNLDANFNGVDDAYDAVASPSDLDNDGVFNFIDIDSDNDGIYDLVESGSNAIDINLDGIVDGNIASFGTNGLSNSLETVVDNGILNYLIRKTDIDLLPDYVDLDADEDECFDVIEAGFLDPNKDGYLGDIPVNIDSKGKVTTGIGYTNPAPNYLIPGIITITTQPSSSEKCKLLNTTFSIVTNFVNSYQWQFSIDNGLTFNNLSNDVNYSGVATNNLTITTIPFGFNGYKYRVYLTKNNNTCGKFSDVVNLKVNALPVLSTATLIQCDDDFDGISTFNLNEKNNSLSVNAAIEDFTFFKTEAGAIADSADILVKIFNPLTYTSGSGSVWVRVTNDKTCFSVVQLNLVVSIPPINLSTYSKVFEVCDDFIDSNNDDNDGISSFNFSSVVNEINALLVNPNDYTIKFYKTKIDALQEFDASGNSLIITNISSYRNIGFPNTQKIWVRIENTLNNACFGFGDYITLNVNKLPKIKTTDKYQVCLNLPNVFQILTAGINDGTSVNDYTYIWSKDNSILANTNATLSINQSGIYTVEVKNKLTSCSRIRTITVTASETAILLPPTIEDLNENATATINVTGIGNYEYSLDLPNGPFQDSNVFDNISFGAHEIYVNDKNKCGIVKQTINIIGAPKFFTPNGDGVNDFWNIKGTSLTNNYNSKVTIFDRFGQLITKFDTFNQGWDGKLNNELLFSNDYWYVVELEDGRIAKGHFSLKR
jgi:gliding motility-associated-like protein